MLEEIGEVATTDVTASLITAQVRAELALVRGDVAGGLAAFDLSLAGVRGWGFGELSTNGLEPWTLIALATDLAAHARFAQTPGQRARADDLAAQAGDLLRRFPTVSDPAVDFPIAGMALAAYGVWLLTRDETAQSTDHTDHIDHIDSAIRLVALAHGFGYNRWFPVMAWEPLVALADAAAPGRLAAVLEEYDDRHGRQLRPEAERVLARLLDGRPTPDLTSSG